MATASDNSNRNGSDTMGMGGSERIDYNLIRKLLLVSDPLLLFSVHSWWTCVVLVCVPSHWFCILRTVVLLCIPLLCWTFWNGVLMSVPSQGCWSRQILVFMSSPSLNGWSLKSLVFDYFLWLMFPPSGSVRFIFLPDMSNFSFDASLWWNGCIPMSFASVVGISTFVQGDVGFAIGIWAGRVGSGGGVPLGLSGGTLFLGSNTSLEPWQVLHFFLISLSQCVWWWLLCGPVCGTSHGTLYVGNRWSIIFSFPIVVEHVWVGFGPFSLRNWLALRCLWVSIHWAWIHFELFILWFLWSFSWRLFAVLIIDRPFGCFGVCGIECPEAQ